MGKAATQSLTIWGAVVVIIAQLVKLVFGVEISAEDQVLFTTWLQQIIEIVTTGATILGGIVAVIGRLRAKSQIVSVVK